MSIKIIIEKICNSFYYIRIIENGTRQIMMSVSVISFGEGGVIRAYTGRDELITIITPGDYDEIEYKL